MYCTVADVVSRFGERELLQLTDRNRTGEVDETAITRAIGDASHEIDSYLGARYELPLASIPPVLVPVCADMARYYLYEDRVTEHVKTRYTERVAYLVRVSKSTASLPVDESAEGEPLTDEGADTIQIASDGHDWRRGNGFGA